MEFLHEKFIGRAELAQFTLRAERLFCNTDRAAVGDQPVGEFAQLFIEVPLFQLCMFLYLFNRRPWNIDFSIKENNLINLVLEFLLTMYLLTLYWG